MNTLIDPVNEVARVVGKFRRQLADRLNATSTPPADPVPGRDAAPGRPSAGYLRREAATELGLVPNTASTLVSRLAADGLLIRTVDTDDRRVGRLRLTEPAQRIADESRAARRAALSAVLDDLEPGQLDGLSNGTGRARRNDPTLQRGETTMTLPIAIDCRNLTHRYGEFTAVDDLTLQVRCGETMGLLGPTAQARPPWCGCSQH